MPASRRARNVPAASHLETGLSLDFPNIRPLTIIQPLHAGSEAFERIACRKPPSSKSIPIDRFGMQVKPSPCERLQATVELSADTLTMTRSIQWLMAGAMVVAGAA